MSSSYFGPDFSQNYNWRLFFRFHGAHKTAGDFFVITESDFFVIAEEWGAKLYFFKINTSLYKLNPSQFLSKGDFNSQSKH